MANNDPLRQQTYEYVRSLVPGGSGDYYWSKLRGVNETCTGGQWSICCRSYMGYDNIGDYLDNAHRVDLS